MNRSLGGNLKSGNRCGTMRNDPDRAHTVRSSGRENNENYHNENSSVFLMHLRLIANVSKQENERKRRSAQTED